MLCYIVYYFILSVLSILKQPAYPGDTFLQNSTNFLCEIYVVAKELPMQKHIFMHEEGHFNVSRFQQVKLEIGLRGIRTRHFICV